jgi:hypothetical protein
MKGIQTLGESGFLLGKCAPEGIRSFGGAAHLFVRCEAPLSFSVR